MEPRVIGAEHVEVGPARRAVEHGVVGEDNASNITGHSGDAEVVERGRQLEGSKHLPMLLREGIVALSMSQCRPQITYPANTIMS